MQVQAYYDIGDRKDIYFETGWHSRLYLKDIIKQALDEYFSSKQAANDKVE